MMNLSEDDIICFETRNNSFTTELKEYLNRINADYLVLFSLKNCKVRKIQQVVNENYKYSDLGLQNLHINIYSELLNKMINEKKMIINENQKYNLIRDSKKEIYIPLIKDTELTGFIYIGRLSEKTIALNIKDLNKIMNKYILEYLNIEKKALYNEALYKVITFVHEVFKNKSEYMIRHNYNVATWAISIAKKMNFNERKLFNIYIAALMHDIGKIFIDNDILNKEGKCTEEEYEEIKKHVEIGYNYYNEIMGQFSNSQISRCILEHHEKWDGTGYPNKLKGEEISVEGRILRVADSIDAILSERSYKNKNDLSAAIRELRRCKGKDFDPIITDITIEILKERINYIGILLEEPIIPGRLALQLMDGYHYIDGFVRKEQNIVLFDMVKSTIKIDKKDIIGASLAIERLNIVFEYSTRIKSIYNSEIILSNIEAKENRQAFGLLWALNGELIEMDTGKRFDIVITRISGNDLVFNLENDYKIKGKKYGIIVEFEDGTEVPLTGEIINEIKVINHIHYRFLFVGIKERCRDMIFRQIFRKQIEMRKMLNGIA